MTMPVAADADKITFSPDRSTPLPLYFQLASRLEAAIRSGELPPGARVENELSIAHRLGLSRPTVRRAIQELVDAGLLVRRRGIGTQVVHGPITRRVELTSLHDDLGSEDRSPETTLLSHETGRATVEEAGALGIDVGKQVLRITRLRLADGVPIAVMTNTLPPQHASLTETELGQHGLYQLLRERGVTMRVAKQLIGARAATDIEAELLGINPHDPVLTMARTAYDAGGRAVEWGTHCYRPDRYSFAVTLVDR